MKALRSLLAAVALVLTARAAEPLVVAANPVLADLVRQVAGDTVTVEVLLPEDAVSREYEPTPEVAAKLDNAILFVVNGAGYEPWLQELLKLAKYTGPLVDASENVPLYDQSGTLHPPDTTPGPQNLFEATDFDPFAWHDPRNVVLYAESIGTALSTLLSAQQVKEIDARLPAYTAELRTAHQEAQNKLAAIPAARRRLASPYDTFRYFAQAYNLQTVSVPGLAGGTEPRPAAMERMFAGITQLRVPAVFFEKTANARALQRIASETGTKTVTTLIAEGLGPVGSPTGTYLGMFRANVTAIVEALK